MLHSEAHTADICAVVKEKKNEAANTGQDGCVQGWIKKFRAIGSLLLHPTSRQAGRAQRENKPEDFKYYWKAD